MKAHSLDAGFDLQATKGLVVYPNQIFRVGTGIEADIPPGHVGLVCARSGLALKHGVVPVNAPGIIDAGYSGEIVVGLIKLTSGRYDIKSGDRIAQLVVVPLSAYVPGLTSDRGEAGFGSTGQ